MDNSSAGSSTGKILLDEKLIEPLFDFFLGALHEKNVHRQGYDHLTEHRQAVQIISLSQDREDKELKSANMNPCKGSYC